MGLFDSYYDPQTYQSGGGLIERLLAQIGTQSAYQPTGQGFPQNPMNANAAAPNDPIGVGNYQMPRIGSGFQADTEPAEPVARPQMAPQQMAQPQQTDTFGNHLIAGAQNFAHGGGLIPAIVNGITGLATGERMDPLGVQQRTQQQTYAALVAAGIPPQKAMLAAIDPEAHKTIVGEAFGKDKFSIQKTGQNGLGQERYEVFNPATGEHRPIAPASGDESGGLGNMNLTGKDYLASIPAAQRGIVQGVAEATIAPPSSFALGKPYWQNIIQAAKNYDPTFDQTNWSGRVAGVKDFSSGKSSEMVRAANQTLHHTGQLLKSMDDLNNGDYPLKNWAGNAASEATGGGAQLSFRLNAHAVADEMSKVFKGAGISDAEIRKWEENLSENASPDQQRAAVGKLRDLLKGSLEALEEKRVNSIGPIAAEKQGPIIKPEGQKVLQQIDTWLNKNGKTATPSGTARHNVGWSLEP